MNDSAVLSSTSTTPATNTNASPRRPTLASLISYAREPNEREILEIRTRAVLGHLPCTEAVVALCDMATEGVGRSAEEIACLEQELEESQEEAADAKGRLEDRDDERLSLEKDVERLEMQIREQDRLLSELARPLEAVRAYLVARNR